MKCKKCGSKERVKSGVVNKKQRYECKSCGCNYTESKDNRRELEEKLLALQMYSSGMSFRAIGKLLKVSNVAVLKWVRDLIPKICKKPEIDKKYKVRKVEIDEMWHFIDSKKSESGSGRLIVAIPVESLTGNLGIVIEERSED
jgi:transposase-like protein